MTRLTLDIRRMKRSGEGVLFYISPYFRVSPFLTVVGFSLISFRLFGERAIRADICSVREFGNS